MALKQLPADSGQRLAWLAISTFTPSAGRFRLIKMGSPTKFGKGAWILTAAGKKSIGKMATYCLHTFRTGSGTKMKKLNRYLKGASNYHVMDEVIGAIPGVGTAYGLMKTALSGERHTDVLARIHDKVCVTEVIGKWKNKPTHMARFILVDPYRKRKKGSWLIHEERTNVHM